MVRVGDSRWHEVDKVDIAHFCCKRHKRECSNQERLGDYVI